MNPHHPTRQQPKGQTGFSFIETLIVLAVLSVVVVQQLRTSELTSVDRVATGMVEKFQRVQRASMRYYSMTDSWPEDIQTLVEAKLLTEEEKSNSWGKSFEFKVEGQENQDLLISSDLTEVRYASRVAGRLPRASLSVPDAAEASGVSGVGEVSNAGTVANALTTKVTSRIDPPGHEAAHEALYSLDGSRQLTGAMDAGDNNIENVGVLELADDVVLGTECDQKYIGTTVTGMLVSCVGASENNSENTEKKGKWRIPNELPVGAVYISLTEDNPSGLLGYGEWVSFGEEQVLVGQKKSDIPNADKRCIPGENNEADCWQYTLGQTNQKNSTTNITEATQLSLSQTPVHRHFADFTKLENDRCNPDCTVLSGHSSDYNSSATEHRALGTTRSARTHMSEAKKELLAIIANLEIEIAYYLNTLNSLKIKPYRSVRLGDAEFGNGHDHKINQPSIVVKMWKRTG